MKLLPDRKNTWLNCYDKSCHFFLLDAFRHPVEDKVTVHDDRMMSDM